LKDAAVILSDVGTTKGRKLFNDFNKIIRQSCREFEGQIAQSTYDGFVVTFASVSKSVECAVTIQDRVKEQAGQCLEKGLRAGVGIHGGEPVTDSEEFFGDTIQLAERLCYIAAGGEIRVSSDIKEQFKKEKLSRLPESKILKSLSSKEEQFLNRLMDTTGRIWNREGVKVKDFCRKIGVSKSQLYRNTTKLTGRSPTEFIKEFKLKKAVELMAKHPGSIAQVAFETGFNNPSYFSKCFKERFGILPSEYKNRMD
jgi:AraC-like DNA-binding protein